MGMTRGTRNASPKPDGGATDDRGLTNPDPSLLSDISRFVEMCMGLHFPAERHRDLERDICSAAGEFGFSDVGSFIRWLLSSPLSHDQIEMLASHLTVGETYFFRDMGSFDALGEHVLPGLICSRKGTDQRLRIWSVGCSTGEEAYSIAILLDKMIPDLKDWSITILATDINPDFLNKAAEGVYREWSFRDTPQWVKEQYFTKTHYGFEVLRRIRKMVTFAYHNLAADPYPALATNTSAMDVIFCRNVLMYFSCERALEVVLRLHRCLMDDGWLIISPVESSLAKPPLFEGVTFPGATLYKKTSSGVQSAAIRDPESCVISETGKWSTEKSVDQAGRPQKDEPEKQGTHEQTRIRSAAFSPEPLPAASPAQEDIPLPALARAAADKGELSKALELCEKAINADKLNSSLYYLHATILQEIGRAREAATSLKRAIYISQDFVLAHVALGHLMHQQERYKEAEKCFESACALLESYGGEEIPPESEGISAGRLMEVIRTMRQIVHKRWLNA
jgi:chemotaxis protein methyltransferase CheR